jgi:putative salt-induced outer membrane protein
MFIKSQPLKRPSRISAILCDIIGRYQDSRFKGDTMPKVIAFLVLSIGILCTSVFADQIRLKNGDRLTGSIIKSDKDSLSMKTELAGEVKVQWEALEGISSNQPLYVTLRDGQTIVGIVTTTDGKIEIQTTEAGKVTINKEGIQLIRSKEEQTAYQAEIDRLRHPKLSDFWSGLVDAGFSATRGNADTSTFNLGAQASRTTPRDRLSVYAASLLAKNKDKTTGETVTTAKAIRGGLRYDFNLSERLFAFALSDLEHDKFQQLDLRLVLGGGLGFHAKKTERTRLDLFAGGSLNQEYFSTGLSRKSGEALLGEEISTKVSKSTSLTERLVFYPNLNNPGEFRTTLDATAVTRLSTLLSWQFTLSDRYLSNPIPGVKKNDVLFTTGLRLTFGRKAL